MKLPMPIAHLAVGVAALIQVVLFGISFAGMASIFLLGASLASAWYSTITARYHKLVQDQMQTIEGQQHMIGELMAGQLQDALNSMASEIHADIRVRMGDDPPDRKLH